FDLIEIPGFWQSSYIIENPAAPDSEFIFPLVYIGNSPLGDSLSRVYVLRTNIGILNGNVQIIYKDIQNPEEIIQPGWLDNQITNENGDPIFTEWCQQDISPYWSFAVDEQNQGRIAFIGYADYLDEPPNPPVEEGFFVYESLDYGETWTLYDFGMPPAIENLLQLEDDQGNVLDSIEVGIIGFNNTALFGGEGNLPWCYTGSYGYTDDEGNWNYFDHFIAACEFVWFGDDIVEWRNVWPQVPWEVDENGDTLIHYSRAFHYDGQKQAVHLENNWIVQVWTDGTYQMFAEDGDTTYQDYLEHPIIFVSATKDNGVHWTEPIELTDIYSVVFPDFSDQITVYPYICDQIVDLGDGWGQVYMYYFDDYPDFGIPPYNPGGQILYCSFKIHFDDIMAVDEEQKMPSPEILIYNHPNPMRNSTTISFLHHRRDAKNAQIRIYNLRGQLVKQLSIDNYQSSIEWDGKDENGRELPNGIYLYQLNIGDQVITKKMILLR
ncbi:MAG: T9SS type A sorting domain-containing protein, partial [Candidatus Cloacimonetes bacterium]|nr:T9SS type A sorting domain-containing protein [Candidatus Cloacimonadota bacterium]